MEKIRKSKMWILLLPLEIFIIIAFVICINKFDEKQIEQGRVRLEKSLYRASVACYAIEGCYPTDLEYLKEHYGIQINEKCYEVDYRIFASNIMPDITVLSVER